MSKYRMMVDVGSAKAGTVVEVDEAGYTGIGGFHWAAVRIAALPSVFERLPDEPRELRCEVSPRDGRLQFRRYGVWQTIKCAPDFPDFRYFEFADGMRVYRRIGRHRHGIGER